MKAETKTLIKAIAIPLVVGGVSGFLSRNGMEIFDTLNKPPLSPPGWLFPVVWTILYVLMGIASYLVFQSEDEGKSVALKLYALQLAFNFFWSLIFFNGQWYLLAFFWLIFLWGLILLTTIAFKNIDIRAGWLMVPYLLWVTFAGYLNLMIYMLN